MKLVGTVHLDLEGPKRLDNLLNRLSPGVVSVEWPKGMTEEETVAMFRKYGEEFRAAIAESDLPDIYRMLLLEWSNAVGYEVVRSLDYCRRNGSELVFIDHPGMVERTVAILKEVRQREILEEQGSMIRNNCAKISYDSLRNGFMKFVDGAYYDAEIFRALEDGFTPKARKALEMVAEKISGSFEEEREQFMADELLAVMPDLHIGGMGHIFEGYGSGLSVKPLYVRLGSAVQEKIRLCEEKIEWTYFPTS